MKRVLLVAILVLGAASPATADEGPYPSAASFSVVRQPPGPRGVLSFVRFFAITVPPPAEPDAFATPTRPAPPAAASLDVNGGQRLTDRAPGVTPPDRG
jgi:hypothetical protein